MFTTNVDDKGLTNSFSLNSSGLPIGRAKKYDENLMREQIKKLQLILDGIPSQYPGKDNKGAKGWQNRVKGLGNKGSGEDHGI